MVETSKTYTYSIAKVLLPVRGMLAICVLLILGIGVWSLLSDDNGKSLRFLALATAGAFFAFWAPISIGLILSHGGLSINDVGLTSYVFGWKFRVHPWSTITRAERVNFLDTTLGVNRSNVWLTAGSRSLRVGDDLTDYSACLEQLNVYIARYGIPAFEYDHAVRSALQRSLLKGSRSQRSSVDSGEIGTAVVQLSTDRTVP